MNRYKLYMIFGICTLILSISGTFAYYMWASNNNALVNASVCTPTISFAGGSTINGTDMVPVLSKEEGTIKDIEVKKNGICSNEVTMNLYLELTTFPKELANSSFKYELYKNDIKVTNGNFSEVKQGDTITLISNEILNTSKDLYTLYIYIDGNVDNPIEMAGKSFLFKVWGSGTGAIYKENVITPSENPSSGSSKFFDTDIMRNQIETITIADSNKVPEEEGIVSKDISSNKDGTVMLWYKKNNNGNYDMWLGGENGVLQANTNASGMFSYLTNVEKLDLSKLDTTYITNMSRMFYSSSGLKEINLSNFNTSKVTVMYNMFRNCSKLTELNVSKFNTSKVTNMYGMFYNCSNITTLNLSKFNTSNVTDMSYMFEWCSSLASVDLSNFNTSNVTNMSGMFYGCNSLTSLNLSSFNTTNVTSMANMLYSCSSLTTLDLSSFNVNKVTNMNFMFYGTIKLKTIYVSDLWNVDNVTNSTNMFGNCKSLVGATSFNSTKIDKTMANYTTGYLTYKSNG